MDGIEQPRRLPGKIADWIVAGIVLALSVAEPSHAACDADRPSGPPNHFIVLLDGSGSMQTDYGQTWWKPGLNKLPPIEKSARIDRVVRKALEAAPEGFPCFLPEDRFSFAFFSLDWENPSYKLENLFIVPGNLLLRTGWPEAGSYWPSTDIWSPREPFHGHSPIVHATTGIFPYLGGKIANAAAQGPVGRTILVRISDGSYNTLGGMVDEDKAIQRIAEFNRGKKAGVPTDHGDYDSQTESARNGLDVGFRNQTCALVLADNKIYCGEAAKASLEDWSNPKNKGLGLLITYLEAKPRIPPLETLTALPNTTLTLRREARDGVVYWQDEAAQAALLGWASADGALQAEPQQPVGFYVKTPGGADSKLADCKLTQAGADKRQAIDCGGGRSLPALDAATAAQYQRGGVIEAYYQTVYRVHFQGTPPAYPLEWEQSRPIPLQLTVAPGRDEQYHPSLWPGVASPKLEAVSDLELIEAAGGGTLKASDLAVQKTGNPKDNTRNLALEGFAAVVLAGLAWVFWPPRRRQGWHLTLPDGTVLRTVDFNRKRDSLGEQIGQIALERTPPHLPGLGLMWQSTPLSLAIPDNEVHFQGPAHEDRLRWNPGMLGAGGAGQADHEDRNAFKGNIYPLLFDASKIADFETKADGPVDGTLRFNLQASFPVERTLALNLRLVPERAKFRFEEELWRSFRPDSTGRAALFAYYGKGDPLRLVSYALENQVTHAFSEPAQGLWLLSPRALDGKPLAAGAFYLVDMDEPADSRVKQSAIDYVLRKGAKKQLRLVADLKALGNPLPGETREYEIKLIDQDGKTVAEHRFVLERDPRTFIQMALLDHVGDTVQEYDEQRHPGGSLPAVDLSGSLHTLSEDVPGHPVVFRLRLANSCENGVGYADWRVLLDDPAGDGILKGEGVDCPLDAFTFEVQTEGTLYDDSDKARRQASLRITVNPRAIQFKQRESRLDFALRVEFDKYEDGRQGGKQTLSWSLSLRLGLLHIPSRQALAIDFGASAIAVTYGVDELVQRLPIAARLAQEKDSKLSQCLEESPYLLCSDSNLAQAYGHSRTAPYRGLMRPDDPDYLTLPADKRAALDFPGQHPPLFPSIKMLLLHNYDVLPIDVKNYPYIKDNGRLESEHSPSLKAVLRGVFAKLRDEYVQPLLQAEGRHYHYLIATHPNGFSASENAWFREALEKVFFRPGEEDSVYPENIHLLSESDAVLYCYLLNADKLRGCRPADLPELDKLLIWDIGADTLDMTLAHIQRQRIGDTLGPPTIFIGGRHGAETAGNLLTECIARDLDQWLRENLDAAYLCPIVQRPDKPFPADRELRDVYGLMLNLREQIERYKRAGSAEAWIQLRGDRYDPQHNFLIEAPDQRLEHYRELGLRIDAAGNVAWQPRHDADYVKAFADRAAAHEPAQMFDNPSAWDIDTVILSGRTSLWPGLVERLRETLPQVQTWVEFAKNPVNLKNAVAEGAVISQTRWRDTFRLERKILGEFALRYEGNSRDDWRHEGLPDGQPVSVSIPNANICHIGLLKPPDSFVRLASFAKAQFRGDTLILTLSRTQDGGWRCDIKNATGAVVTVANQTQAQERGPRRTWPLTHAQLPWQTPENIARAVSVNACNSQ